MGHLFSDKPAAPAPGKGQLFPWRFALGARAYVRDWGDKPLRVVGGSLHGGFPHLELMDSDGACWRIPQIHALSKAA